jgi:hypothetical protein
VKLKLGTTAKYFTIEDRFEDITKYFRYTGVTCNTLDLSVRPNEMVNASFGVIGVNKTIATSPLDASITDASGNTPFDSFTGTISEGGSPIASITAINLKIDNGMRNTFAIGSQTPQGIEFGRANVTGEITAYFENTDLINKFINETESSLEFALTDGTSTYTFNLPRVKYMGGDVPLATEQSRILTLPFQALRDDTEEVALILTKS